MSVFSEQNPIAYSNIISSAGGVANSLIGGAFSLGGMALQHKYNKEMADIQNQYNIDMWNMQNQYNSPQAQMERLKDAGLNANLMYGMGNVGNSSSAPQKVAPNAPDAQSAMRDAAKALNPVEIINLVTSMRKNLAEAQSAEERARILGIQGDIAQGELDAFLYPLYNVDLETQSINHVNPYEDNIVPVTRYRNPYRNLFSGSAGSDYFSFLNALKTQKEILGNKRTYGTTILNNKRSFLMQKDIDWYTANNMSSIFGKFTPIITTILGALLKKK